MDCYPKDLPEDIYTTEQRNDFHVKQIYDNETCETVISQPENIYYSRLLLTYGNLTEHFCI